MPEPEPSVTAELPELDPVVHGKLRLALLSLLAGVEEAEFTWLRAKTASTDGNLGAQLLKLEQAGYVSMEKRFVLRKPQTLYRITREGRQALSGIRGGAAAAAGAEPGRVTRRKLRERAVEVAGLQASPEPSGGDSRA